MFIPLQTKMNIYDTTHKKKIIERIVHALLVFLLNYLSTNYSFMSHSFNDTIVLFYFATCFIFTTANDYEMLLLTLFQTSNFCFRSH